MRRTKRVAVDEAARLHPNDWSSLEVRLLDISERGFRAECEAAVLAGSPIRIELPGLGPVEAQVAWCRRGELGASFVRPIDLADSALAPLCRQQALVRLLLARAEAQAKGALLRERELRGRIAAALPIVGNGAAAPQAG